jgi:hypothetical protein
MKQNKMFLVLVALCVLLGAGATVASATSLNDSSVLMGYGIGYWFIGFAALFGIIALVTMKISGHKAHPGKISIPFIIIAAVMMVLSVVSFSSNTGITGTTNLNVNTPDVTWTITATTTSNVTTIDPTNRIITIQCAVNSTSGAMKLRGWTQGAASAFVPATISFACQPNIPNGATTLTTSATLTASASDPGNCITSTTTGVAYALILKEPVSQQAYLNWTTGVGATLNTQRLTKQITVLQGSSTTLNFTENFNDLGVSVLPAGTSKSIPITFQFGSGQENWVIQLFVSYTHV